MLVDMRSSVRFPAAKASEKVTRTIQLYNRLLNEVSCEAKISNIVMSNNTTNNGGQGSGNVEFNVTPNRGKFSAYNMQPLEFSFQSMRQGTYKATLEITYQDSVGNYQPASAGGSQKSIVHNLVTASLVCVVGKSDIQVHPATISFGDVPVDEQAYNSLTATNVFPVPGLISFIPPGPPFFLSDANASSLIKTIGDVSILNGK